ncbi:MAG: GIY-YIG nuclease family protein [Arenimonas sp.]
MQAPILRSMRTPCVYLLASRRLGTIYCGVTSDLVRRAWEHRCDFVAGFTRAYGVHRLVWYELHGSMYEAISREKRIKEWQRAWKVELIEATNPGWVDLYPLLSPLD